MYKRQVYNPAVALADSDMTGGSVTGADGNELAGTDVYKRQVRDSGEQSTRNGPV